MANRFNRARTTDDQRVSWRVFFVALPVVILSLIVGLRPSGYFFSVVVFCGLSLGTGVDDVRRSCFLADSGVGALCFSGTMESA